MPAAGRSQSTEAIVMHSDREQHRELPPAHPDEEQHGEQRSRVDQRGSEVGLHEHEQDRSRAEPDARRRSSASE